MKIEQIRDMKTAEINEEIEEHQKKLMHLRMGNKIGTVENPIEIRRVKRTIARMKTILTEKKKMPAANQG